MGDQGSIAGQSRWRAPTGFLVTGIAAGIITVALLKFLGLEGIEGRDFEYQVGTTVVRVGLGHAAVGIAFGFVVGGLLRHCGVLDRLGPIAYAVFSSIGFCVAENVARDFYDYDEDSMAVTGAIAGLSGAAVLGVLSLTIAPAMRSPRSLAASTATGMAAGVLLDPFLRILALGDDAPWSGEAANLVLYCGWQGAYAASIGYFLAPRLLPTDRKDVVPLLARPGLGAAPVRTVPSKDASQP